MPGGSSFAPAERFDLPRELRLAEADEPYGAPPSGERGPIWQ
jgi:hypothetical protein